jgi:peptidoglycan/xylan/chitin deacetylase (PgdA/CDA1 family)
MLTFRNVTLLFLLLTALVLGIDLFTPMKTPWIYGVLIASYLLILFAGTTRMSLDFFLKGHHRGQSGHNYVAITLDDGPSPEHTDGVLKVLDKYNVKATFFIIGEKASHNKDILRKIHSQGHRIGNHTWSHAFWFDLYPPGRMIREIIKTDQLIQEITGEKPKFFRPPYGVINPMLVRALKKTAHQVVGWSIRTFDTTRKKEKVLKKVRKNIKGDDIILLHDHLPHAAELLEKIILLLREKNLEIVPLETLL